MVTLEQVERFHRLKNKIANIVLKTIGDKEIIHGERAIMIRLPPFLHRHTKDYDVISETPRKDAIEAEKILDKEFGGDLFQVKKALHEGTWRVKSKVDGESYADFSKKENEVLHDIIQGKKYMKLEQIKKKIKETLKNKEKVFRHAKDKDALNRILVHEEIKESLSINMPKAKRGKINFI